MKICKKCGVEKQKSMFGNDSSRADGLYPYCKDCRVKPKKERKARGVDEVLSNHAVDDSGCWIWLGVKNKDGYGMACYKGVVVRAHRLSYFRSVGVKDFGGLVLHKCDNRACINPSHLYAGTNQDNTNDMKSRNRFSRRFGSKNSQSKISESDAVSIFIDNRCHKEIAKDYGLSASAVSSIKTGRNWGWATAGVIKPRSNGEM